MFEDLTPKERQFLDQAELFVHRLTDSLGVDSLRALDLKRAKAADLQPVVVSDYRALTEVEKDALTAQYFGEHGVAYFVVLNPHEKPAGSHALFDFTDQLRSELRLEHPLDHPLENHPEVKARFGRTDGTVKVYDLPKDPREGYREQAETNEMFDSHNDGLGYGGAVQTVILWSDGAPLWGGYTFFVNTVLRSLELAATDFEAFAHLFLPNAITAIRPRGKGAIKVVSPVLFINENDEPQVFFRVASGEYQIAYRRDSEPARRAFEFLEQLHRPFAYGTSFAHFMAPGHGCLIRNQQVIHGRTPFLDDPGRGYQRLLSRKWFVTAERHAVYKHIPTMYISPRFAKIFPEQFGAEFLDGEWNYDSAADRNVRVS